VNPHHRHFKGRYIGNPNSVRKKSLRGKTALLTDGPTPGTVLAQFDDIATGLGYYWHKFPAEHFAAVPDTETAE
jgi:hypothetical protein